MSGNGNNTIEAIVDVVVYERGSNVEYDYMQFAVSYGRGASSSDVYDCIIGLCKEARGDKLCYRVNNIIKWNV